MRDTIQDHIKKLYHDEYEKYIDSVFVDDPDDPNPKLDELRSRLQYIQDSYHIPEEVKELALYSYAWESWWNSTYGYYKRATKAEYEDVKRVPVTYTKKTYSGEVKKVDYDALEKYLIKRYAIVSFNEILYIFKDGMYRENKGEIEETIKKLLENEGVTKERTIRNTTTEILQRIQWSTFFRDFPFNNLSNFIPLENGVLYRGEEYLLLPNSPIYGYTYRLPVRYNPEAECPKIDRFIESVVEGDDRKVLYEIPALCLLDKNYEVAYMLIGGGANGKTTYLKLITHFLGKENVSDVTLQDLASDKFKRSMLVGKLANISADIPEKPIKYTGFFKMLVTGDRMPVERKFKDAFEFENKALLIFSANKLPEVTDKTEAFWRRWILIEFPNTFSRNPNFLDQLLTEEELSGFLNRVLHAMTRIEEMGITVTDTMEKLKEDWMCSANSAYAFAKKRIELDPQGFVTNDELYSAYALFCEENNFHAMDKIRFSQEFQRIVPQAKRGKKRVSGTSQRVWIGIRIKEEPEEPEEMQMSIQEFDVVKADGNPKSLSQAELVSYILDFYHSSRADFTSQADFVSQFCDYLNKLGWSAESERVEGAVKKLVEDGELFFRGVDGDR